jgi:hypothetical protein
MKGDAYQRLRGISFALVPRPGQRGAGVAGQCKSLIALNIAAQAALRLAGTQREQRRAQENHRRYRTVTETI